MLSIKTYYSNKGKYIGEVVEQISEDLINKVASKLFLLSDKKHMRDIAINACGSIIKEVESVGQASDSNFKSSKTWNLFHSTFPLSKTIEEIRKCNK
jgi:23S rRNA maturation-related 3'-5' exoribonuclease YhaM